MYYEVIIYPNLLCTLKIIPGVLQLLLSWVTFFSKYCNDYICVSPSPSLVTSECVNQVSMAWKEARNLLLKSEHTGRQIFATQHRDRSQHDVHHQTVPSNLRSMLRLTTDVHSYRTRSVSNQHYFHRRIWNKSYMNCGNENQFMQLRKKPEKKIRTSTGFELVTCDQNPLKSWIFFRLLTQLHKLRSQLLCRNKLLRYNTNFLPEETKFRTDTSSQAINYQYDFLLSLRNLAVTRLTNTPKFCC